MSAIPLTPFLRWAPTTAHKGVLTGVDANQEWLLPLWLKAIKKHTSLPITFVDFGMSASAKAWCTKQGTLISSLDETPFIKGKRSLCPILAKFWQRIYPGDVWKARSIWFKKPLALLKTPYEQTLWLDVDCQVRCDLAPVFAPLEKGCGIALCRTSPCYERSSQVVGLAHKEEKTFNSGVITYKKGEKLIATWAKLCLEKNEHFLGDENALNRAIFQNQKGVFELPLKYNLPYFMQEEHEGAIIHYLSGRGKTLLLKSL